MNELIITPEQKKAGYPEMRIIRRDYVPLAVLPDGNYIVVDPHPPKSWSEQAVAHRDLAQASLNEPQPMPIGGSGPDIWGLVIADVRPRYGKLWSSIVLDMADRNDMGRSKYGQTLRAGDGRDHLIDEYQESLDCVVYIMQQIEEVGPAVAQRQQLPDIYEIALKLAYYLKAQIEDSKERTQCTTKRTT